MGIKKDLISGMFTTTKEETTPKKAKVKATIPEDNTGAVVVDLISFKIPKQLHLDIKHLAEAKGITSKQLIINALTEVVNDNRKELDKVQALLKELGVKE